MRQQRKSPCWQLQELELELELVLVLELVLPWEQEQEQEGALEQCIHRSQEQQ